MIFQPLERCTGWRSYMCGVWVLISSWIYQADPRFPQDQKPSCVCMAAAAAAAAATNYRCDKDTRAYAHTHTCNPCHTDATARLSRNTFLRAEVIKVTWRPLSSPSPPPTPSSLLISDERAPVSECSVHQSANPRRDGGRETDKERTNELRESQ